jgi:hypothetical protein
MGTGYIKAHFVKEEYRDAELVCRFVPERRIALKSARNHERHRLKRATVIELEEMGCIFEMRIPDLMIKEQRKPRFHLAQRI